MVGLQSPLLKPLKLFHLNKCDGQPVHIGIDEAGRGCVLGAMVYACFFTPFSNDSQAAKEFAKLKVDDSKKLKDWQREESFAAIEANYAFFGWGVHAVSAQEISAKMLRKKKYSLNEIAFEATVSLIGTVLESGVNVVEAFIDTVGPAQSYQAKLQKEFPTLKIKVAEKADSLYRVVSAASIVAKVLRDKLLVHLMYLQHTVTEKSTKNQQNAAASGTGCSPSSVPPVLPHKQAQAITSVAQQPQSAPTKQATPTLQKQAAEATGKAAFSVSPVVEEALGSAPQQGGTPAADVVGELAAELASEVSTTLHVAADKENTQGLATARRRARAQFFATATCAEGSSVGVDHEFLKEAGLNESLQADKSPTAWRDAAAALEEAHPHAAAAASQASETGALARVFSCPRRTAALAKQALLGRKGSEEIEKSTVQKRRKLQKSGCMTQQAIQDEPPIKTPTAAPALNATFEGSSVSELVSSPEHAAPTAPEFDLTATRPSQTLQHQKEYKTVAAVAARFGSGYPADPLTIKYLKESFHPVLGFHSVVRYSWSTIQLIFKQRGVPITWYEDVDDAETMPKEGNNEKLPANSECSAVAKQQSKITSFFQTRNTKSDAIIPRPAFFVRRRLQPVQGLL